MPEARVIPFEVVMLGVFPDDFPEVPLPQRNDLGQALLRVRRIAIVNGVGEVQSPATKVLAENSVLLLQIIDHILPAAVHPAGRVAARN